MKKTLKRIVALVIAMAIALPSGVMAADTGQIPEDVKGHWIEAIYKRLLEYDIPITEPNGLFYPDESIRMDMAGVYVTQLLQMLGYGISIKPEKIETLVIGLYNLKYGYNEFMYPNYISWRINGYLEDMSQIATRELFGTAVYNALYNLRSIIGKELVMSGNLKTDSTNPKIIALVQSGIFSQGDFRGQDPIKRAELLVVLCRALDYAFPNGWPRVDFVAKYETWPDSTQLMLDYKVKENKIPQVYVDELKNFPQNAVVYKMRDNYGIVNMCTQVWESYLTFDYRDYIGASYEEKAKYISTFLLDPRIYNNKITRDIYGDEIDRRVEKRVDIKAKFYSSIDYIYYCEGIFRMRGIVEITEAGSASRYTVIDFELNSTKGGATPFGSMYLNFKDELNFKW